MVPYLVAWSQKHRGFLLAFLPVVPATRSLFFMRT